jgi:hypothetical protein
VACAACKTTVARGSTVSAQCVCAAGHEASGRREHILYVHYICIRNQILCTYEVSGTNSQKYLKVSKSQRYSVKFSKVLQRTLFSDFVQCTHTDCPDFCLIWQAAHVSRVPSPNTEARPPKAEKGGLGGMTGGLGGVTGWWNARLVHR